MPPIPVSLQLWSVREAVKADFAGTMRTLADIGYTGAETAGFGNLDAAGAARAMTEAGLLCSGMHVSLTDLRNDLPQVMTNARLFGTRDIICPHFPRELLQSAAAYQALGGELDAIGARLRAFGYDFHYHNHDFELVRFDGRIGLDWLLDAACPGHLGSEADVYWLHHAGKDPAAFIREQGRRIQLVHLKDETELGSGPVDFPAIFTALDAIGAVRWYVVEIERYNHAPLESARLSFRQMQAWHRA